MKQILSIFFLLLGYKAYACSEVASLPFKVEQESCLRSEQQALEKRSPARIFVNSDRTLTSHVIKLLQLDNLYDPSDDLFRVVEKTQKTWISVFQGRQNKERTDLKDSAEKERIRQQVEDCAEAMGLFAERTPLLTHYTYGVCHGAFLDGVRRNLFQLVHAWKKGIRFDSLIFLTGARDLRKRQGENDSVEKLCDEKGSPLPFKNGWELPENAAYDTEYDMVRLVWSQVEVPDDMARALEGKVVFVNAPKGKESRPSTKDAFVAWLQESHPQPGTILACSYPLLWAYQQLVGETVLYNTGLTLDTMAPALSQKERLKNTERMVSLVFDTTAKCLYEISQQQALHRGTSSC